MNKIPELIKYIHIHPLLWAIIGLSVATAHFIELCLLLLIIFVHEMGHAAAAALFSWRIKRIALLPFGGVAEMDEHGNRPLKEEIIVIISGPLQHIWMMGAALLFYQLTWMPQEIFQLFIQFNLMILIFNLLPVWPLDGGKLIFLWMSRNRAFPDAHRKTLLISGAGIFGFIIFTLLTSPVNLNMWVILAFLMFSLYHEWKQSRFVFIRFLLERYYGKNSDFRTLKPLVVKEEELVIHVLERFQRGCKHPIIIEKDGKEKGSLDENELLHAYFAEKVLTAKVGDLLYVY
ncbi:M50 family metallopeptidase [Bacillus sp. ISL-47]|uniref:M50 family metallopeptidase n=1 Tax=Bacillus sp. ISL-47 TaxID=2819130 RepID=UPI001BECF431|nr:M50 family metallopeptidase [Bacillus sp. ISL-47]MBT2688088.1 M50 family metallopeptidase [Bacillus sp. ISL-47]MBT2707654.1 M50 family metallopeptidase [Pseudomonas sp. ISL-84]